MTVLQRFARNCLMNWRWWVVLPLVPACVLLIVMQQSVRLMSAALAAAEQESRLVFNWSRKGWRT